MLESQLYFNQVSVANTGILYFVGKARISSLQHGTRYSVHLENQMRRLVRPFSRDIQDFGWLGNIDVHGLSFD